MSNVITAYRRPDIRQAWRGPSLLALDSRARAGELASSGFFFRETRYLRRLRLLVAGEEPTPCSSAEVAPNALEYSFSYPPVATRGGGGSGSGGDRRHHGILSRGLDLDVRFRVHPASFEAVVIVCSRWDDVVEFDLAWELGADFRGVIDALGEYDGPRSAVDVVRVDDGVDFRLAGGGRAFAIETRVRGSGGRGWSYSEGGASGNTAANSGGTLSTRVRLARQESATLTLCVEAYDPAAPITPDGEATREAFLSHHLSRLPRFHAPGETPLVTLTGRALHDIYSAALLDGPEEEWLTPAAGYPEYGATFGRDAATASWQAGAFDHGVLARSTAARLARLQGTRFDDARDEAPGRIIQQSRVGPRFRAGDLPYDRYYGDVASPFMYIIAVGNAYAWSGDRALVERHWDPMRRVLDWARKHGDRDGDGYIEYLTLSKDGPKHQGWKDSDNAVVDEHGRQLEPPFTTCEIQGYYMAALQVMAALAVVMGEKARAIDFWLLATRLKKRFTRDFWLPEEGYIAFGLDADKRPVPVLTSNAGQCIATGIVSDDHLPTLVGRLFEPDLYSGWGIRTLTTQNPAYNPLSYHLGSVWPVENGSIVFGLRRFGFDDHALELTRALYDLARLWPAGRTPECVGGYARQVRGQHRQARGGPGQRGHPGQERGHSDHARAHPGAYPQANSFQSWNESVHPIVLQSLLGARAVGALHLLAIDPLLPEWLPEVTVTGWRIGNATVSIRFWRTEEGKSRYEVLDREGELRIVRQSPVDSLGVGPGTRLGDLLKDVLPL